MQYPLGHDTQQHLVHNRYMDITHTHTQMYCQTHVHPTDINMNSKSYVNLACITADNYINDPFESCTFFYIYIVPIESAVKLTFYSTLKDYWLRPFYCTVSHHYEEELLPPRSTPWGAYRSAATHSAHEPLNHMASQP